MRVGAGRQVEAQCLGQALVSSPPCGIKTEHFKRVHSVVERGSTIRISSSRLANLFRTPNITAIIFLYGPRVSIQSHRRQFFATGVGYDADRGLLR